MNRQYIVDELRVNEFTKIIESHDGLNALLKINENFIKNQPVKFLIVDNLMPNINGIDLILKLRENENFKTLPVILQTSEIKMREIKSASDFGYFDFIKKPVHPEMLIYKMENLWQLIVKKKET